MVLSVFGLIVFCVAVMALFCIADELIYKLLYHKFNKKK